MSQEEEEEEKEESEAKSAPDGTESGGGGEDWERRWVDGRWVCRNAADSGGFLVYDEKLAAWQPLEGDAAINEQRWTEAAATTTTPQQEPARPYRQIFDGVEMEWNPLTSQWFPVVEVDEDFLAQYQANYGIYQPPNDEKEHEGKAESSQTSSADKAKAGKRPREANPGWVELDESKNCSIYVSGLPQGTTNEEFAELMSKCGVIMKDPRTNKPKIKLYRDSEGNVKGDGTCCYIKIESVDLAMQILDGCTFKGSTISIEPARFEMKGEFDPKKKRKRLTAAQKKRMIEQQQKIFEWKPEKPRSYRPINECTVVLKKIFELKQFEENPSLLLDLEEEVKTSCSKYGVVKKVVVYDNNPDGVVTVQFENVEMADQAVRMLHHRVVDGRQLEAQLWDGKTRFKVEETEEQRAERMARWAKFIASED